MCKYAPFWQEVSVKSHTQVTVKVCGPLVIYFHLWILYLLQVFAQNTAYLEMWFRKITTEVVRNLYLNHAQASTFQIQLLNVSFDS